MADSFREETVGMRQGTFLLGVMDFLPADLIPDNKSALLQNAEIHKTGAMRRRGGLKSPVTMAALTGPGKPRLLRMYVGKGHGPAKVAAVHDTEFTSKLAIEDGFGTLTTISVPFALSDEAELVQILDRIYVLDPGHSPVYWQWGNVQANVDGFGSTAFPQSGTAMFFRGRGWCSGDPANPDLVYFSLTLGAEPYEEFLNRTEDEQIAAVNTSGLSEENRTAARTRVRAAVDLARTRSRRDKRRLAGRERGEDQAGFGDLGTDLILIGDDFELALPELSPVLETETQATPAAFGMLVWNQTFQAFRMVTGRVQALIPFRNDAVLVFTDRGIEIIEPDPCDVLESRRLTVSTRIGSVSKQSIQTVGEDVIFQDQEGHVRSLAQTELDESRGILNSPLSQDITGFINRLTKSALSATRSALFDGVYYIAWATGGSPSANEIWGYSVRDKAWTGPYRLPDGMTVHGFAPIRFDGDQERLYVLVKDGSNARTFKFLEDFSDNSTAIPFEFRSKNHVAGNNAIKKTWVSIDMEARVIQQPSINPTVFELGVRGEEGAWITLALLTLGSNAGPQFTNNGLGTFGITLPFHLIPDNRQRLKASLTGIIPRSHGLQMRIKESGTQNEFEVLSLILWGFQDPVEYN